MKTIHRTLIAAVGIVALASGASARVIGGSPAAGCLITFEGVNPSAISPNRVECQDGSPCDQDGAQNNSCTMGFTLCGFQTDVSGCTPSVLKKPATGNAAKLGLNLPDSTAAAPTCAAPSTLVVTIKGKKPNGKKKVKITAVGTTARQKDKNKITFVCTKGTIINPGAECANNPAGGPRQLTYTIADHGTDLDTGFSGVSHNFPVINQAHQRLCLTECDGTSDLVCKANGPTGPGTFNGATLGPPLPLFAAGVPVCVINEFVEPSIQGTVNVETGEFESVVDGNPTPIRLNSVVFNTSAGQVCPKCAGGTCDSGPNQGQACTEEGNVRVINPPQGINELYRLSSKCPPGGNQGARTGAIPIILPLTTGTSTLSNGSKPCPGQPKDDQCATFGSTCSVNCDGNPDVKGGFNQWCCGDAQSTPCFPTANNSGDPNHAIVRTGSPVVPSPAFPDQTYPKTAAELKQAATFCIASSGSTTIDQVAGLPGPGALIFNGTVQLDANQ